MLPIFPSLRWPPSHLGWGAGTPFGWGAGTPFQWGSRCVLYCWRCVPSSPCTGPREPHGSARPTSQPSRQLGRGPDPMWCSFDPVWLPLCDPTCCTILLVDSDFQNLNFEWILRNCSKLSKCIVNRTNLRKIQIKFCRNHWREIYTLHLTKQ
jgi:hypothetical protein